MEMSRVTLTLTPRAVSSSIAPTPAAVAGTLMSTFGWPSRSQSSNACSTVAWVSSATYDRLEVAAARGADTVRAGDARGSSAGDRRVAVAGISGVAGAQPLPEFPLLGVPGAQRHRDPDVAPTAVLERRLHPGLGMAEVHQEEGADRSRRPLHRARGRGRHPALPGHAWPQEPRNRAALARRHQLAVAADRDRLCRAAVRDGRVATADPHVLGRLSPPPAFPAH